MKTLLFTALTALALGLLNCHPQDPEPQTSPSTGAGGKGTVRPVGNSLGAAVSKKTGPDGGSLKSADGALTITVPAGALTALTEVGIEPITSTCDGSIGHGWRLTSHGKGFAKPVTLTMSYIGQKDSVSLADALGMAYQDDQGVWRFIGATSVNKSSRTLTARTSHFSDWISLQWMTLFPVSGILHEGESIALEARTYIPIGVEVDDLLFVPLVPDYEDGYPVGEPQRLNPKYVRKWSLAGPGTLTPKSTEALYKAPASVQNTQTVAVSLELNMKAEQAILVANLTIVGKDPFIEYLQVAEQQGPTGKQSELLIYGVNFGAQDKAKSGVSINGAPIPTEDISLWGDNFIVCSIPLIGPNSTGQVRVTANGRAGQPHILNEWNVVMNYQRGQGRVGESIREKITFHLRIRGDASPPPANMKALIMEGTVNTMSYAHWEAGGTGSSSYENNESCASETVRWTDSKGDVGQTPNGKTTDAQYFVTRLYHKPGTGFEVEIDFHVNNAVPVKHVITPCQGDPIIGTNLHSVSFPVDWMNEKLRLSFNGSTLKGGSSRILHLSPDSKLSWDATDYPVYTHDVKVVWSDTPAKYCLWSARQR